MMNSPHYLAVFHQLNLSSDEQALLHAVVHSANLRCPETVTQASLVSAIATFSRPTRILQCSFRELLQISDSLNLILQQPEHWAHHQICRNRHQQVFHEIQARQTRFEKLGTRLQTNLQTIRSLNMKLYDRVFAKINFDLLLERVLDGDETSLRQELSNYQQVIHEFYEELMLRQLAPIACHKNRLLRRTKRLEFFYEYLPVLSLILTMFALKPWFTWTWAFIAAMFIVGPMMIWFAYPKRCALRTWAKQSLEAQQTTIAQGRSDLTAQEAQVLNLLRMTVEGSI
ncbi:MAG: hypothetical protein J0L70_02105 [Leptolyngbya sp. UWPOB_LEPTO1]|uniref:hypothetical protein n=1 Tax=Leptolyngbya sp. UWPOB_LEPTO1 TaxID=2815653 RepID=UPI001ACADF99|nr:hypothetical protein [Leptolyngbya sp. UWPOB_LEPTO1]MBN8559298.1 hypothetical protein [Leptolyngbya sp. UWPOB_LEPTO1]